MTTALVASAALLATATAASAAAPTKAQYIAAADSLCTTIDQQAAPFETEYADALKSRNAAALKKGQKILRRALVVDQHGLTKLEALPRPTADVQVLAGIWQASGMRLEESRRYASAMSPINESKALSADQGIKFDEARYQQMAKSYGFTVCGSKPK